MRREARTLDAMMRLYCRKVHGSGKGLCPECGELKAYAHERLNRCRFGEDKPVCSACTVHCYKPAMRERIRQVMRYSGPRLLVRHPVLALLHLLDARRR
ncbi:MAG TPA: nitrous oxide-stimulated promoter family protein [Deltaproteobacteria bacterium]|nr:nitrous oxide-stimulated promoter family protein [Deltaproteobacteria bacterium]